jgi:hypothetical protein
VWGVGRVYHVFVIVMMHPAVLTVQSHCFMKRKRVHVMFYAEENDETTCESSYAQRVQPDFADGIKQLNQI